MNTPLVSPNTLIVKRLIKAPRERVYAAWTSAEELKQWFGPESCRVTSARIDLRVGGKYHMDITSERMGEVKLDGVYREIAPPSRLVFTWKFSGPPELEFPDTLVTVDFRGVEEGTDVQITHEELPNAEIRDDHTEGWNGCLDKLQKALDPTNGKGMPPLLGTVCWNELLTSDVAAAKDFYTGLFGWQAAGSPVPGMDYTLFKTHTKDAAGMMPLPMAGVPPHWLAYVHVKDVDATAAKAAASGGKVCAPAMDIPNVGRIAVIQDPQGAALGLFKPGA
jgi:uncharacterized protein YndB with AHSA1/START domain/predicted enzyme related to lactoylglutathione lyase